MSKVLFSSIGCKYAISYINITIKFKYLSPALKMVHEFLIVNGHFIIHQVIPGTIHILSLCGIIQYLTLDE